MTNNPNSTPGTNSGPVNDRNPNTFPSQDLSTPPVVSPSPNPSLSQGLSMPLDMNQSPSLSGSLGFSSVQGTSGRLDSGSYSVQGTSGRLDSGSYSVQGTSGRLDSGSYSVQGTSGRLDSGSFSVSSAVAPFPPNQLSFSSDSSYSNYPYGNYPSQDSHSLSPHSSGNFSVFGSRSSNSSGYGSMTGNDAAYPLPLSESASGSLSNGGFSHSLSQNSGNLSTPNASGTQFTPENSGTLATLSPQAGLYSAVPQGYSAMPAPQKPIAQHPASPMTSQAISGPLAPASVPSRHRQSSTLSAKELSEMYEKNKGDLDRLDKPPAATSLRPVLFDVLAYFGHRVSKDKQEAEGKAKFAWTPQGKGTRVIDHDGNIKLGLENAPLSINRRSVLYTHIKETIPELARYGSDVCHYIGVIGDVATQNAVIQTQEYFLVIPNDKSHWNIVGVIDSVSGIVIDQNIVAQRVLEAQKRDQENKSKKGGHKRPGKGGGKSIDLKKGKGTFSAPHKRGRQPKGGGGGGGAFGYPVFSSGGTESKRGRLDPAVKPSSRGSSVADSTNSAECVTVLTQLKQASGETINDGQQSKGIPAGSNIDEATIQKYKMTPESQLSPSQNTVQQLPCQQPAFGSSHNMAQQQFIMGSIQSSGGANPYGTSLTGNGLDTSLPFGCVSGQIKTEQDNIPSFTRSPTGWNNQTDNGPGRTSSGPLILSKVFVVFCDNEEMKKKMMESGVELGDVCISSVEKTTGQVDESPDSKFVFKGIELKYVNREPNPGCSRPLSSSSSSLSSSCSDIPTPVCDSPAPVTFDGKNLFDVSFNGQSVGFFTDSNDDIH